MKICAVICEYNPFHYGHAYQLKKIKEKYDRIVCIMSGNFTQRAEPAFVDKYLRAKQAINNGADLVLQLPTVYACSAAPVFARGAINILRNLPIDAISFGMEDDNVNLALQIAECENKPLYKETLKSSLEKGESYIRSSIDAITVCLSDRRENVSEFLEKPNNMLAIEYLKAIKEYNLNWEIFPIKRENNYNSDGLDGNFVSSSAIRAAEQNGLDISKYIPNPEYLLNAPRADKKIFDALSLSSLRLSSNENLSVLSDAGEGLEIKLYKNALACNSITETQEQTKSKRYSFARIKRLTLNNLLSINKTDVIFPERATAIMLAVRYDFTQYLNMFSPHLVAENSGLADFIPERFTQIEERAEKIYSIICSTPYCGIIKKLVKV